tara:strand:+ start:167 stop:544 length:378 start_codon:yes stop_codon:yes gene_type:complete
MMEHKSILLDRLSREQKMIVKTSQIRDLLDAPISSWLYNRGAFPMVQSTIKMAQGAYPETVDKIYVVNTPWLMSTVWCEFVDVFCSWICVSSLAVVIFLIFAGSWKECPHSPTPTPSPTPHTSHA